MYVANLRKINEDNGLQYRTEERKGRKQGKLRIQGPDYAGVSLHGKNFGFRQCVMGAPRGFLNRGVT